MALIIKKSENDNVAYQKLNKLINDLEYLYYKAQGNAKDKRFIIYLENARKNPDSTIIRPFPLLVETAITIVNNRADYNLNTYIDAMRKAEDLYPTVFPFGENTLDFEVLSFVFLSFFHSDGLGTKGLYDYILMSTFKNKENYVEFMTILSKEKNAVSCLPDIRQYGLSVRAFFIDDETYTANMKQVGLRLVNAGNRAEILKEELKRVEHMAGIYTIDEADVAKTEQQLVRATALLNNTVGILEEADRKTKQLQRIMKDTTENIQEISKRETSLLSSKATSAREDIEAAYNSFLEEQKQEINIQKDVLISQIYQEAESKLNELKNMAKTITISTNTELQRINKETANAMEKIQEMATNDKEIQKILERAEENRDLYNKISKLEILNNQNIEAITRGIEAQLASQSSTQQLVVQQAPAPVTITTRIPAATNTTEVPVPTEQAAPTANVVIATEDSINTEPLSSNVPVNKYLDTRIPFAERYGMIMAEKQKRIDQGEHFHKMFDDVLTILLEDANPYMIGPSGCGKTYMVKQIATLLNLDFTDIGYINEEYDILGFQTATGDYSPTNFYRCYKFGKIAFCDELDNGNSRATVKLNSFLSNSKDAQYNFPNGESVKRHPNFRIIAAGNTAGNGADANYNTREKIEESVQQRFTPIYVGYDNAVEEKILGKYTDWYKFTILFRKATDAWSNKNDCAAPGILTTRDAARIRRYLDNGSLDMERILDYEFIQTKDMEYLAFLSNFMEERLKFHPETKEILKCFCNKVKALREAGGIR